MTLDPASIDLPTLAFLTGSAANELLLARLRDGGHPELRNSHGYVFQHLIDGPRAVGELAEQLGVTQQAASKVVLELTQLGYVVRQVDTGDSRIKRVALSASGRKLVERSRAARAALERRLVEAVGERSVATARRTLLVLLEQTGGLAAVSGRKVRPSSK